jgi:hypothetical protein
MRNSLLLLAALFAGLAFSIGLASATQRVVVAEEFTATW